MRLLPVLSVTLLACAPSPIIRPTVPPEPVGVLNDTAGYFHASSAVGLETGLERDVNPRSCVVVDPPSRGVGEMRVRVRDMEHPAKPAPPGEPGELVVAGPQVMQGYWNRPETATEAFIDVDGDRWLRTGDVAVIDTDGFVSIVDRIKDMIAVGGFKVFPSQVEAVLLTHPAVKEALVLGLPDAYHGEMPRAFVTLVEGESTSGDELANWLNARIGKHERVSAVVVRQELPKTMVGKPDRKALSAEVLGGVA
jgi:long-chain acyl-CoA synthetase